MSIRLANFEPALNINHLPDSVLLIIFSYLDVDSIESVELVSKRWSYLSKMPELWIYKVRRLALKEDLKNIDSILLEELNCDEDIDWKLAFVTLEEFVSELRKKYMNELQNIDENEQYSVSLQQELFDCNSIKNNM